MDCNVIVDDMIQELENGLSCHPRTNPCDGSGNR